MATGLIKTTILKASTSTLPSLHHQTPIHNSLVPLTIFDKAAFDLHVAILYAFKPPMPSNEVLKETLSKVLVHYPHLAGRYATDEHGRTCMLLNNAGVRVTETYVPTTLAAVLPFSPSSEMKHLLPLIEGIEELFQIQFNRYACGGMVFGLTSHHRVADAQSMSSFFISWAKMVRGIEINPLPYHDRAAVTVPRSPPRVEFDHPSLEFRKSSSPTESSNAPIYSSTIESLIVHYPDEFLNKLKSKISQQNSNPHQKFSTFECLLAHLWKRVTQARGLEYEESTQVRVAVNGRARIKPPVPMEYFGNLVLWAYPRMKVENLLKENHAQIAAHIHDAVVKVDNKYFQSFIDFGEVTKDYKEELDATAPDIGNVMCPNIEVDSWMRFEFHDLDFGGGGPCAFFPPNIPVEGLLIFLPSCREGGGVDLVMSLLPEHTPLFRQISHSLD